MKRTLLVLVLALGFAKAQEPGAAAHRTDLAAILPSSTMMMFEINDLGDMEWRKDTALGRIWAEPEVQVFVQGLMTSVEAAYNKAKQGMNFLGMFGLTEADLLGIHVKRFGVGVVDFSMERVDAVLALETSAGGDKAKKVVDALRNASAMFLPVQWQEVEVAGKKMHAMEVPNHVLHLYAGGNHVIATTTRARMEQLLGAIKSGNQAPLHAASRFATARSRMSSEKRAALMYADVPAIYERAMGIARQNAPRDAAQFHEIWRMLGLDAVDAVAFAEIPQGHGFRTEFAITHRERRGIFSLMQTGQANHRFAKFAPHGAMLYGAEHNDLGVWMDRALTMVQQFDADAHAEVMQGFAEANRHLGIDLRNDLLGSLGSDWGFYIGAPHGGGIIPDIALFVTLKNKEHFRKTVGTMLQRIQVMAAEERVAMTVGSTKFRGRTIEFVELAETGGDPIPVTPSWGFGEDFVVFGAWPHTVKNALMDKASLADAEAFKVLAGSVPRASASVMYLDAKTLVGWIYNTAVPVLQGMQGAANRHLAPMGVRINLHDLPTADVITRHLGGAMMYTSVEPDCVRMGFLSDYGASFIILPVALVAGVAAPIVFLDAEAQRASRDRWRRMQAEQRTRQMRVKSRQLEVQLEESRRQLAQSKQTNDTMVKRVEALEKQLAELKKLIDDG